MKIKGAYVLTLRSIKRMIAVLATVFSMLCPAATTPDEVQLADRYAFASQCLMHMRGSLMSDADRIIVPDAQYREFKTLYLISCMGTVPVEFRVKYHGIHGSPHSRDTESSNEKETFWHPAGKRPCSVWSNYGGWEFNGVCPHRAR